MARKKKVEPYHDTYYPASEAARIAIDGHPGVQDMRMGLTKAVSSTIKRYLSHKPLKRMKKK
jgi:hypothetical protein